jgi:hypothetical protein
MRGSPGWTQPRPNMAWVWPTPVGALGARRNRHAWGSSGGAVTDDKVGGERWLPSRRRHRCITGDPPGKEVEPGAYRGGGSSTRRWNPVRAAVFIGGGDLAVADGGPG